MVSTEIVRMRDSQFSNATFLGEDESLLDLIKNDNSVLIQNDITWEELANAIASVVRFVVDQPSMIGQHMVLATYVSISKDISFRISGEIHMGYQFCPFDKCLHKPAEFRGEYVGSTIVTIVKQKNNKIVEKIQLGSLLSHLCMEHQFLEGKDCEFRVDPQKFIDFFELKEEKKINGTISTHWFGEKIKRKNITIQYLLDPIPNNIKLRLGRIGGGPTFC